MERRILNRAIFARIEVGDDGEIKDTTLTPVYQALAAWAPTLGRPCPPAPGAHRDDMADFRPMFGPIHLPDRPIRAISVGGVDVAAVVFGLWGHPWGVRRGAEDFRSLPARTVQVPLAPKPRKQPGAEDFVDDVECPFALTERFFFMPSDAEMHRRTVADLVA